MKTLRRILVSVAVALVVGVALVVAYLFYTDSGYGHRGDTRYFRNTLGQVAEVEQVVITKERCFSHPHSPCGDLYLAKLRSGAPASPAGPVWPPYRKDRRAQPWSRGSTDAERRALATVALACATFIFEDRAAEYEAAASVIRVMLDGADTYIAFSTRWLREIRQSGHGDPRCLPIHLLAYNPATRQYLDLDYIE